MRVFDYDRYKHFVVARVKRMPHEGRGQWQKMAAALRIHTTLISQIFRGDRNVSPEQTCLLAEFLGLNELETEYLLALVQWERAGSEKLRLHFRKRADELKRQAETLQSRMPSSKPMAEDSKATFYSNWYYSAIRQLVFIPAFRDVDAISDYLKLPKSAVAAVIEFLLSHGLCEERDGKLAPGPSSTHIRADSPHAVRHHTNWRLKAIERFVNLKPSELA